MTEPFEGKMRGTSTPSNVCTKLERIAELAKRDPTMKLRTLAHHIDVEWLTEAFRRTRKDGAVGVDGQTAAEYARNLETNLQSLLDRAKSGTYRAPPVRRVHIPKGNGETRALGIPTFEDKVLQRAVAMVLEAVYEQDFLDCSYGFRPGRSPHDALDDLQNHLVKIAGGWLLEVDLRKFFDTLDHAKLMDVVRERVTDGVLLRLISKWLHAGVMERGEVHFPKAGTPQGGVISPLLANIFLHTVLDKWVEQDVLPQLRWPVRLFRYADDAVLVFQDESDAQDVHEALAERCEHFGLVLHPEKTRLINFRRPGRRSDDDDDPPTFDLLGFTHFWETSLSQKWLVKRKTARDRFRRAVKSIREWCNRHRHDDIPSQRNALVKKLEGHYAYYGVLYNVRALKRFLYCTIMAWWEALRRRSQRGMTYARMGALLRKLPLPQPRVTHLSRHLRPAKP